MFKWESFPIEFGQKHLLTISPDDARKAIYMPQTIENAKSPTTCTIGNIVIIGCDEMALDASRTQAIASIIFFLINRISKHHAPARL
mmetsp:Transcript_17234/g.36444  ORF Transcript_17234/g.36444 Transcript_17234/m.36444 type:complete len:87 (-) Transcript_17234:1689-1949(-)